MQRTCGSAACRASCAASNDATACSSGAAHSTRRGVKNHSSRENVTVRRGIFLRMGSAICANSSGLAWSQTRKLMCGA